MSWPWLLFACAVCVIMISIYYEGDDDDAA